MVRIAPHEDRHFLAVLGNRLHELVVDIERLVAEAIANEGGIDQIRIEFDNMFA
ncbi:hypothetical protein D3C87_2048500 [compost metagenome]